jgi:MFS family permease
MRTALAIPAFRRLVLSYTLNELCDWMATVALAVLVYDRTSSALATAGLFFTAKFLPSLLVPALTARAERLPVARCLAGLYATEAVVFVVLAFVARDPWVPLVCALAFVDGTIAATGRAVTRGATASVLEPAGVLREGNAVLNLGFSAMSIAGPALAGFVVAGVGVSALVAITAGVFACLAIVMATSRGLPRRDLDATPWLARLRAGAAYVATHPVVRPLVLGEAVLLVLFTMASPIEIVYAKESLGGDDATYGTLLTAWGAGVIVGSLIFARVHSRPLPILITFSTLVIGVAYTGMAISPSLGPAAAAAVLGGIGNGTQWVIVITAIQEAVREDMQARVAGFFEAIATAAPGVGFITGGVLAEVFTPRAAFLVAGLGVVVVVLAGGLLWRLRRSVRDVVAYRADHPVAIAEIPLAAIGTAALPEVAAAPSIHDIPDHDEYERVSALRT